jgi:hypothetical protein
MDENFNFSIKIDVSQSIRACTRVHGDSEGHLLARSPYVSGIYRSDYVPLGCFGGG